MPRISAFFGIVVYMYYDDHPPPHFHAMYEGEEAVFQLDGALARGRMPARALRLIREWATEHSDELAQDWKRAEQNLPLHWIEPLR